MVRAWVLSAAAFACLVAPSVALATGASKTVCTITVNSPDEAEAFRRALPAGQYRFVELVEKGRSDWLAAACRSGVQCDALIVSGHFDGEGMFFSDRVDGIEHLPVSELERVSCSDSCPGLFDRLQQVYLFGCNTLASEAVRRSWRDSGVGASYAPGESVRHGESSRDRMTRIFRNVPVLYGFRSQAPVGPVAGDVLDRYFRAGGTADVTVPRRSARLLAHFAPHGMIAAAGIREGDARLAHRRDVCAFADERRSPAEQAAFVHALLRRDAAAIVTLLEPLERFAEGVGETRRASPEAARILDAIRDDVDTRDRLLSRARAIPDPELRVRLVALAHRLGWLTVDEQRNAWLALLGERLHQGANASDVDLACRLAVHEGLVGGDRVLDGAPSTARRAMQACLGDPLARAATLQLLADGPETELVFARVLLEHRPVTDGEEFRSLATAVAQRDRASQARAFDALGRHPLPDARSAALVAQLFTSTSSVDVRQALASMLVRADLSVVDVPRLRETLRRHQPSSGMLDVLDRRLQSHDDLRRFDEARVL